MKDKYNINDDNITDKYTDSDIFSKENLNIEYIRSLFVFDINN